MTNIGRRPEEPEGAIITAQSGEQHDTRAHRNMILVPLTSFARLTNGGLRFPVNQVTIDRVVLVARRWGELSAGLVEREYEKVARASSRAKRTPSRHSGGSSRVTDPEAGKDLSSCVASVDPQRHFGLLSNEMVNVIRLC